MSRVVYQPLTISRMLLFYVCPLLSLFSLRLILVPNPLFSGWSGIFLFLILGIAAAAYWLGRSQTKPVDSEPAGLVAFRFIALSALFGFVAWAFIGKWLPWGIAEGLGKPYTREAAVQMEYVDTRRECKERLKTPLMQGTYPNFMCADRKDFLFISGWVGNVRLTGKQTFLGGTVDRIELIDIAFDPSRQRRNRNP